MNLKIRNHAITASLLLASILYLPSDFHGSRGATFLLLGCVWLGTVSGTMVHWSVGAALAWALCSGARVFGMPTPVYGAELANLFDSLSAQAFIAIALTEALIASTTKTTRAAITQAFGWLCILDSIAVIGEWIVGAERGGFFGNPSMNACVIAITYPIWTRRYTKAGNAIEAAAGLAGWLAPILAILISRSNMAVLSLMAVGMAPVLTLKTRNKAVLFSIWLVSLPLLGWAFMGSKIGQDSGRFEVWRASLKFWWEHFNPWVGSGLGSYFAFGPHIQSTVLGRTDARDGFLMVLHSDWLQILFEQGIIGLALAAVMVVSAFRSAIAKKRMWLLASMSAYVVTACGNFPMHLPVPGFLGMFLLVSAFV